ncbi:MAG: hypothetical protein AW10_03817 [Candidatus Accumulibacter appositus]|uniref:Uncharacterized protein n=1 Tax=Candidatus Accumulibacter appositus TaxID=1454003 RepID=A0A011N4L7_9PROT|nr:MAG: hypothetical protein AW10_03817 [Candidatus Accumulibacter appositus]
MNATHITMTRTAAATLPSSGAGWTFLALVAWDSFFHLSHDDQRRMFPSFARHAAPGALLLFTSGPAHGESIGSSRGEPL